MTQHALYQWPHPLALYPDRGKKSYRMKRLRYRLRSLLHQQAIKKFEYFVNQNASLVPLLNTRPDFSYPWRTVFWINALAPNNAWMPCATT